MPKWADYVITKVRMNAAGTHIEWVEYSEDLGNQLGPSKHLTRQAVVALVASGKTFVTATRVPNTLNYSRGGDVIITPPATQFFIKTKPDTSLSDNLDNLPTF